MRTIEATGRTGPDGVLRLELPMGKPDQTMEVVVVAQSVASDERQSRLLKAGIRPPIRWNDQEPVRLRLGDPPVSQTLIEDRR